MVVKWLLMMALAVVSSVQRSESIPVDQLTTAWTATNNNNNTSDSSQNRTTETTEVKNATETLVSMNVGDDESIMNSSTSTSAAPASRRGRVMDFSKFLDMFKPTEDDWKDLTRKAGDDDDRNDQESIKPIQSRILTGGGGSSASLLAEELADNTFASERRLYASPAKQMTETIGNDKYDTALINPPAVSSLASAAVKTYQPNDNYASLSYSNPAIKSEGLSGYEASDVAQFYHEGGSTYSKSGSPLLYQLVPIDHHHHPGSSMAAGHLSYSTFSDAVKETLLSVGDKVKDHVSGTVQKVKNALGFNGFSEKVASPDALLAVAPVAAGLLAGGLAVAYLASKAGQKNNTSLPFNFFGKRSVRNAMTEEDLQHIVARLDPVQREYLQKLQMYGPQRWKDVTCAKYIFCDVMSRATPLHVRDMQRKIGVFLSRMEETTARYVEVILKDVMLAIQARDCSRFSCGQTTWGLPLGPPPPQLQQGGPPPGVHPFQFMPGNNFLRRQRAKN